MLHIVMIEPYALDDAMLCCSSVGLALRAGGDLRTVAAHRGFNF